MQEYKSPKTPIDADISDVFAFLSDFNNFENLMPQQQITNWKSTDDRCSFTVQGMGDFGLKIQEKIPETKIIIVPDTAKPIPITFNLICELGHLADEKTEAIIRMEAELPAMIALMAGKPLQNLVNILVLRLQEHFQKK